MASKSVTHLKSLIALAVTLINRYPWAVALFGFVSGVASFFLVEREQEKFAQLVSALMLASWIWLTLENLLQRSVTSWFGVKLPKPAVSFATQLVHQESLFFVIPFFFITATWDSGQMVFTSLLIAGALASIIDPIYYRWLAARRWLYFIFHGVTLFAVLLTALPIIFHLPTSKSYLLSLVIAILLTFPGVIRALPYNWWKRSLLAIFLIAVVGAFGLYVRTWIPPATLRLTEVAITNHIDNKKRAPQNELKVVTVAQLRDGLYAYTAIRAPRGLNERIYHVWRLNGREVDRIALNINGGRDAGYRAWTHKLNFPPYPKGRWQIQVITEADQLIGVLRFQVVDSLEQGSAAYPSDENDQQPAIEEAVESLTPMEEEIEPYDAEQEVDTEVLEFDTDNEQAPAELQPDRSMEDVEHNTSERETNDAGNEAEADTSEAESRVEQEVVPQQSGDLQLPGDVSEDGADMQENSKQEEMNPDTTE